jgi:hypothetical protein
MKVIYTSEQIKKITEHLDTLVVAGIGNYKRLAIIASELENPVDIIEEEGEKDGDKQEDNPKHKQQ